MPSCPLYNNNNLDGTGGKMNNPYALIQRAGKGKYKKKGILSKKKRNSKKKMTKKVRFAK